jgi:hypothetical protein
VALLDVDSKESSVLASAYLNRPKRVASTRQTVFWSDTYDSRDGEHTQSLRVLAVSAGGQPRVIVEDATAVVVAKGNPLGPILGALHVAGDGASIYFAYENRVFRAAVGEDADAPAKTLAQCEQLYAANATLTVSAVQLIGKFLFVATADGVVRVPANADADAVDIDGDIDAAAPVAVTVMSVAVLQLAADAATGTLYATVDTQGIDGGYLLGLVNAAAWKTGDAPPVQLTVKDYGLPAFLSLIVSPTRGLVYALTSYDSKRPAQLHSAPLALGDGSKHLRDPVPWTLVYKFSVFGARSLVNRGGISGAAMLNDSAANIDSLVFTQWGKPSGASVLTRALMRADISFPGAPENEKPGDVTLHHYYAEHLTSTTQMIAVSRLDAASAIVPVGGARQYTSPASAFFATRLPQTAGTQWRNVAATHATDLIVGTGADASGCFYAKVSALGVSVYAAADLLPPVKDAAKPLPLPKGTPDSRMAFGITNFADGDDCFHRGASHVFFYDAELQTAVFLQQDLQLIFVRTADGKCHVTDAFTELQSGKPVDVRGGVYDPESKTLYTLYTGGKASSGMPGLTAILRFDLDFSPEHTVAKKGRGVQIWHAPSCDVGGAARCKRNGLQLRQSFAPDELFWATRFASQTTVWRFLLTLDENGRALGIQGQSVFATNSDVHFLAAEATGRADAPVALSYTYVVSAIQPLFGDVVRVMLPKQAAPNKQQPMPTVGQYLPVNPLAGANQLIVRDADAGTDQSSVVYFSTGARLFAFDASQKGAQAKLLLSLTPAVARRFVGNTGQKDTTSIERVEFSDDGSRVYIVNSAKDVFSAAWPLTALHPFAYEKGAHMTSHGNTGEYFLTGIVDTGKVKLAFLANSSGNFRWVSDFATAVSEDLVKLKVDTQFVRQGLGAWRDLKRKRVLMLAGIGNVVAFPIDDETTAASLGAVVPEKVGSNIMRLGQRVRVCGDFLYSVSLNRGFGGRFVYVYVGEAGKVPHDEQQGFVPLEQSAAGPFAVRARKDHPGLPTVLYTSAYDQRDKYGGDLFSFNMIPRSTKVGVSAPATKRLLCIRAASRPIDREQLFDIASQTLVVRGGCRSDGANAAATGERKGLTVSVLQIAVPAGAWDQSSQALTAQWHELQLDGPADWPVWMGPEAKSRNSGSYHRNALVSLSAARGNRIGNAVTLTVAFGRKRDAAYNVLQTSWKTAAQPSGVRAAKPMFEDLCVTAGSATHKAVFAGTSEVGWMCRDRLLFAAVTGDSVNDVRTEWLSSNATAAVDFDVCRLSTKKTTAQKGEGIRRAFVQGSAYDDAVLLCGDEPCIDANGRLNAHAVSLPVIVKTAAGADVQAKARAVAWGACDAGLLYVAAQVCGRRHNITPPPCVDYLVQLDVATQEWTTLAAGGDLVKHAAWLTVVGKVGAAPRVCPKLTVTPTPKPPTPPTPPTPTPPTKPKAPKTLPPAEKICRDFTTPETCDARDECLWEEDVRKPRTGCVETPKGQGNCELGAVLCSNVKGEDKCTIMKSAKLEFVCSWCDGVGVAGASGCAYTPPQACMGGKVVGKPKGRHGPTCPTPIAPPAPPSHLPLILGGAAAALFVVVAGLLVMRRRKRAFARRNAPLISITDYDLH